MTEADSKRSLDELTRLLAAGRVAVLTGAGISTDSGIPDYRGDGSLPPRRPMTAARFLHSDEARRRYWAGSAIGWLRFAAATPNEGHRAVATLQRSGLVTGVATQNVDGLHQRAGSTAVLELHGQLRTVRCLDCGAWEQRSEMDARLRALNPWLPDDPQNVRLNPDGDAEVEGIERFRVPVCLVCGGVLKPDVVFFGETVRPAVRAAAHELVDAASTLLVAGSSLTVDTGRSLVLRARRAGKAVAIVNRGPTAAERYAGVRLQEGVSEVLGPIAARLDATIGASG